jgi:hypothetical protein
VPSLKPEKIDISSEYPCPCGRKGLLVPITLTEAFGCDRCCQIFALNEDGYSIEQLSTHYPNKRCWRWVGDRWHIARHHTQSLPFLPFLIIAAIGFVLVAILSSAVIKNILIWGAIILAVILVLVKVAWFIGQR